MSPNSTKPYLLRAIHEWCLDNGLTPHLAVMVDEQVLVPQGYARDGQIVLNIGHDATSGLSLGNDAISFQARFGGVSHHLYIPVSHVVAIYARENGQGMAFEVDLKPAEPELGVIEGGEPTEPDAGASDGSLSDEAADAASKARGGHLKVVK